MKLVIGNTNYSSWSLRAWLPARQTGIPFEEILIDLDAPDTHEKMLRHSPTGRVPVLLDGDVTVWDSMAIAEYLAEKAPDAGLLPPDRAARARARSIMAEVHAGFSALRNHCPMNIRRPIRARPPSAAVDADVQRITSLWEETRKRFGAGGPFLFGPFSAADAFYAPVASRFRTYAIPLPPAASAYVDVVFAHPPMAEWVKRGQAETWVVPSDEVD